MRSDETLLQILTEAEGYDDLIELLASATMDSVVPGICRDCEATYDCEPDATNNHCDSCGNQSVVSCLVLGGII